MIVGLIGVALTLLSSITANQVVIAIDPLTALLIVMMLMERGRSGKSGAKVVGRGETIGHRPPKSTDDGGRVS